MMSDLEPIDAAPAEEVELEELPEPVEYVDLNLLQNLQTLTNTYMIGLGIFYWYKYPHYVDTEVLLIDRDED